MMNLHCMERRLDRVSDATERFDAFADTGICRQAIEKMKATWRKAVRSVLARDITLAMALKIVLLVALVALFSQTAFRPANDALATAAAVAGTTRSGEANP
jgi:hypothetical protein